jgi:tetratricopeptide (TPR) repeat protein
LNDRNVLIELYTLLAWAFHLRGDQYEGNAAARRAIDRAVELGQDLGDDPIRARPLLAKGIARLLGGRFAEAAELSSEAARILERSGELLWAFESQSYFVWSLLRLGRFEEAEKAAVVMLDLADRSGSATASVDCQASLAMLREEREQYDLALSIARAAAEQGEAERLFTCAAFGHLVEGDIRYRRGEYRTAIRSLTKSSRLARLSHAYFIENLGRASLSAARWETGDRESALRGWSEAESAARTTADRYSTAEVLALRGAALAEEPATRAAGIDQLLESVHLLQDLGARPAASRAMLALAVALRSAGREVDADAAETSGRGLRQELGLPVEVDARGAPVA